jgi:AraC family transcriptional regulator
MRVSENVEPLGRGVILSSREYPQWQGFAFDVTSAPASGELFTTNLDHYWVAVVVSGQNTVHLRSGSEDRVVTFSAGSFCGYPAGQHWDYLHWDGQAVESINVHLDLKQLKFADLHFEDRPHLGSTFSSSADLSITHLVAGMRHEIETGCLSGRAFAESLSLALAARVDALGDKRAPARQHGRDRLSAGSVRRVTDYIENSLEEEISIGDLANLLQLSASRLSVCFRNTFGMPVHRYILSRRIARAVVLLRTQRSELADIAQCCGFASQSHFTDTFRRFLGITPRRYRDGGR